jgi:SAM-dependent methyltransferase
MITLREIDALAGLPRPEDPRLDELHRQDKLGERRRYQAFFYHLVRLRKPQVCLEIGCGNASASAYMALAASEYGGVVVGVDQKTSHAPLHVIPGLFDNFHFIQGDSRRVAGRVAEYGKVGVVWHDSSHLYQESREEWEAYWPLLDENAVWVCDDLAIVYPEDIKRGKTLWWFWKERPGMEKKVYWEPSPFRVGATIGVILL